jgi:hypothetical protein
LFLILGLAGCAPLSLKPSDFKVKMPWQDDEPEFQMPHRIIGFWSDTVLYQKGAPAVRGFGGRLFFYTR